MSDDPLSKTRGVVNTSARREWDSEVYRKRAVERQERKAYSNVVRRKNPDEEGKTDRPLLDGRDVDAVQKRLDHRVVGKTMKVNPDGEGADQGGFWCDLCKRSYKDDMAFLEHVNSRMHQAHLGLSMHVKKSTTAEVKSRLKQHVAQRVEETLNGKQEEEKYQFRARVEMLTKAEEEKKLKQKLAKKNKKEKLRKEKELAEQQNTDAETMAMMGFGSFGGK